MNTLYYDGVGRLEWREDPDPVIDAPTDALVRPTAVSTCDLDQEIIKRSVAGSEQPFAIGHEGAGEVVEIGGAVRSFAPGDQVAIPYHLSCGRCDRSGGAMRDCLRATAPGGHCENTVLHFEDAVELPLMTMHVTCVTLRSALSNARSYMPAVLELLSSGRIRPHLVASEVLPFASAAEALPEAGVKPVFVR